ncbi:MAG: energy transducer TonB [Bacteroidales bacterium]|nr:energy transducer TonB [Bacteroidales bacterium]
MNKILLVCVMLCTLGLNTACHTPNRNTQTDDSAVWGTTEDGGELFLIVEHEPEFPGGIDSLYSFLNKNIHYPQKAIERKIEGKVYVQFIVEKDGSITNAQIVRDIVHGSKEADSIAAELGCGTEVLRVINRMPKWKPASNNGTVCRYIFTLPIEFSLSEGIINPLCSL